MKRTSISAVALAIASMAVGGTAHGGGTEPLPSVRAGAPEDKLPANIRQLTWFGERPVWSPDGKRIAFMSKSFGDAYELEVGTGRIKLITHFPHAGFLRVHYLPNGDYLLIGAEKFEDIEKTRFSEQELWILKPGSRQPVRLHQKISEGVAISRKAPRIAWSVDWRTNPAQYAKGVSVILVAEIAEQDGSYVLVNTREVVRETSPRCRSIEPQDFRNDDSELIWVCYHEPPVRTAAIYGVELSSGLRKTYREVAGEYNEPEGIFPDGKHILVESGRSQRSATNTSKYMDIWKLKLAPNSQDFVRLTRFGDYEGYKASNPAVSPDGRKIAFQEGRSADATGVGYGVFLLTLK